MYSDAVCVCVLTARVAEEEDGGDSDSSSEDEKGATISESNGGEQCLLMHPGFFPSCIMGA